MFMFADLMVEMPPGDRYAEAARGWLDGVLGELFADLREGLRTRPSTRVVSKHWDDGPEGEPGQVRGELEVGMTPRRPRSVVFTEAAWQRFLGSLSKSPATASLLIRVVGEDGYLSEDEALIRVTRSEEEPEWVRFIFWAPARFTWRACVAQGPLFGGTVVKVRRWVPGCDEQQVVERDVSALATAIPGPGGGWAGSAELQDKWAAAVRQLASRIGACAGMITTHIDGPARLEEVTYPDWPPQTVVQPAEYVQETGMLSTDRQGLYRYSWVTIIPGGLAVRLGGVAGLESTGAFFEVSELPGGSVWLRATQMIEEFDQGRSEAVAGALGPVLIAAGVL